MAHIAGRFHEVNAWGGESEALPAGPDYVLQIEAVEQTVSSKKAVPQLQVTTVVLNEGEYNGRKGMFWYNLDLSKETPRKRIRSLVDATGIALDAEGGFDDADLIGRVFMADVVHEPYKDVDATTGTAIEKTRVRIQNERMVEGAGQPAGDAAPAAVAPAAAPAPAAPAAPVAAAPRAAAPARPAAAAAPARPVYAPPGRGAPNGGLTRVGG